MSLEEIPLLEELTTRILRTLHRISEEEMQIIPPLEEDLLRSIVYRIQNLKPWYQPTPYRQPPNWPEEFPDL